MPEDLTGEQLKRLRQQLLDLQKELEELLASTVGESRPVDLGQPIGRLSRVDALQQQSMAQANRHSHEIRLQQVSSALSALGRNEYGTCRECEEPIGFRRLTARPETPLCLECQNRRETAR